MTDKLNKATADLKVAQAALTKLKKRMVGKAILRLAEQNVELAQATYDKVKSQESQT